MNSNFFTENFFLGTLPKFSVFKGFCETGLGNNNSKIKSYNIYLTRCSFFELSEVKKFIDYIIQNGGNQCVLSNKYNPNPDINDIVDITDLFNIYNTSSRKYLDVHNEDEQDYISKIKEKTYIYILYNIKLSNPEIDLKIVETKFNINLQDTIDYPDLYEKFENYLSEKIIEKVNVKDLLEFYKSQKEKYGGKYKFNEITDIWLQESDKLALK